MPIKNKDGRIEQCYNRYDEMKVFNKVGQIGEIDELSYFPAQDQSDAPAGYIKMAVSFIIKELVSNLKVKPADKFTVQIRQKATNGPTTMPVVITELAYLKQTDDEEVPSDFEVGARYAYVGVMAENTQEEKPEVIAKSLGNNRRR